MTIKFTSLGEETISGSFVPYLYLIGKPPYSIKVWAPVGV